MNYYPFHIGDYASATQHLTLEEDAMYRRLLDISYTTEKPLTKDERQLFRLTRASTEAHREAMVTVLHEFFTETDEGWISPRAMAEIAEMQERQQVAKAKANKRWDMQRTKLSNAAAMPQHGSGDAAAQNNGAGAMLPTPTPTPTPNKKNSPDLLSESEQVSEFSIQLVDGSDYQVPERLVTEWISAYPAVDVRQELREMRTWAMANRAKRKTRNGIERFIVLWLGKAQDTPSRTAGQRLPGGDWTAGAQ